MHIIQRSKTFFFSYLISEIVFFPLVDYIDEKENNVRCDHYSEELFLLSNDKRQVGGIGNIICIEDSVKNN